jgi:phosphate starvation-inducible PhoH-like protein
MVDNLTQGVFKLTKRKFAQNVQKAMASMDDDTRHTTYKGHKKQANVVNLKSFTQHKSKQINLIPKSVKQEEYIDLLLDPDRMIIFATGPAGTGKTMLAVLAALKAYKEGDVEKIIITRPAVEVENERLGFLPGDLNEKMAPWTRPIFDVMKEYYSVQELAHMLEEEIIEISPLAFMRGRSFKNAFIIADEMQNATVSQCKMLLTRPGENCRLVITGDIRQTDRAGENNGLVDFQHRSQNFNGHKFISGVEFTGRDIQRHPAVEEVLRLYGDL